MRTSVPAFSRFSSACNPQSSPTLCFFLELALDPAAWPTLVGGDQIVNFTGTQLDLAAPVRSDDIRNYGQYYLKYLMIKALILIVKCFTVKNIDGKRLKLGICK